MWKLQQVKRNADAAIRQQEQTRQKRREGRVDGLGPFALGGDMGLQIIQRGDALLGQKIEGLGKVFEVPNIMGEDGKPLFDAVPTTDWGSPETLEHWREAWAAMVNAKFEEKGLTCRIDHRSYERQGLDLLPAIHEGVAVRQMEAKGIPTDKGDLNRWIRKANNILRDIRIRRSRFAFMDVLMASVRSLWAVIWVSKSSL